MNIILIYWRRKEEKNVRGSQVRALAETEGSDEAALTKRFLADMATFVRPVIDRRPSRQYLPTEDRGEALGFDEENLGSGSLSDSDLEDVIRQAQLSEVSDRGDGLDDPLSPGGVAGARTSATTS